MPNTLTKITFFVISVISLSANEDTIQLDNYLSRTTATINYSLKHDDSTTSNTIKTIQPLFQQNDDATFITGQLSSNTKYEVGAGYRKILDNNIFGVRAVFGRDYNKIDYGYTSITKTDTYIAEWMQPHLTANISIATSKFDTNYEDGNSQHDTTKSKSFSLAYKIPKYENVSLNINQSKYENTGKYISVFFPSVDTYSGDAKSTSLGCSYNYLLTSSSIVSIGANRTKYEEDNYDDFYKNYYTISLSISLGDRTKSAQNLYYSDDVTDILLR